MPGALNPRNSCVSAGSWSLHWAEREAMQCASEEREDFRRVPAWDGVSSQAWLGRGSGARPRPGRLGAGAARAFATCAPLHLGTRRPWIPGNRNHGITELGLCSPRPQRQRPTGHGVRSFLYPSVPGGIGSWDLAMRSEQPSPPPGTPKRALTEQRPWRGAKRLASRCQGPNCSLVRVRGLHRSRPPSLQSAEPLIPGELRAGLGAREAGAGRGFPNGRWPSAHLSPPPPAPRPLQLAASSAEAEERAQQSARSERNVIALPGESPARMQLRKGAAYRFPGAARLAEEESGEARLCQPPRTHSCAVALNPKRAKC